MEIPESVWVPVVVAGIGIFGTVIGVIATFLSRISGRLRKLEHRDRLSWLYIRSLIDHAYRHGATPLPEPPDGWLDETT